MAYKWIATATILCCFIAQSTAYSCSSDSDCYGYSGYYTYYCCSGSYCCTSYYLLNESLSVGAIVGIVIGSIFFIAVVIGLICCLCYSIAGCPGYQRKLGRTTVVPMNTVGGGIVVNTVSTQSQGVSGYNPPQPQYGYSQPAGYSGPPGYTSAQPPAYGFSTQQTQSYGGGPSAFAGPSVPAASFPPPPSNYNPPVTNDPAYPK